MADEGEAGFFRVLEESGEPRVRAGLENREWGTREALVRVWLHTKEQERTKAREYRTDRALDAAEKSASASEKAAIGSLQTATWTMLIAIIACLAIVVQVATSRGWF